MSAPDKTGWMPIESAPRDGSYMLLYLPDSARADIVIGHWSEGELPNGEPDPDADWYEMVGDGGWPIDVPITHWQPLPQPPEDSA